jgi:hypothetical protein
MTTSRERRQTASAETGSLHTQGTLMAIGVEPGRVRACLLEPINGRYRLAAWFGQARRPHLSMAGQAATLCRELGNRLQRRLWNDTARTPLLASDQPLRVPSIEHFAVTLSPLPRLRVAILGLTAGHSTGLAQRAVNSGPAQVVSVRHYTGQNSAQAFAHELHESKAEALILVGGYDVDGIEAHSPLLAMTAHAANALQILARSARPALYFAGNRWAATQAEQIITGIAAISPVILSNCMPSPTHLRLNIIAQAMHTLYAAKAQQTPGYAELAAWSNSGLAPTTLESNFTRLVRVWRDLHALPELHGLYLTNDLRLHVWASAHQETVQLRYLEPTADLSDMHDWPPVQLLSGGWPSGVPLPATVRWWDRSGMAPLVAALGYAAPSAFRQVLQIDLLTDVAAGSAIDPTIDPTGARTASRQRMLT